MSDTARWVLSASLLVAACGKATPERTHDANDATMAGKEVPEADGGQGSADSVGGTVAGASDTPSTSSGNGSTDAPAPDGGGVSDTSTGASTGELCPDVSAGDCPSLSIERGANLSGFIADDYAWYDSGCRLRTTALVDNLHQDPAGKWGGYARRFTYVVGSTTRTSLGSSSDHPGFGYLVNHMRSGSVSSRRNKGVSGGVIYQGEHHAIGGYRWRYDIDGHPVAIDVRWFFATGRDNPVWAVTFDTSEAGPDAVYADSRGPYGDVQWDGGQGSDVDGVGWGDRYRFISLNSPLTMQSGWDYSQPNSVPYVFAWSSRADAEMGLVQTQTQLQHAAGGYGFWRAWGTAEPNGPMPADYDWTYQVDQYELPWGSTSKRLAWGMNYGAVGQRQYLEYGDSRQASGYPYQSYSVFIVLGTHSASAVAESVAAVEAIQGTRLTAQVGKVLTSGPAGVGRSDTAPYEPPGYSPIFATWEVSADANRLDLQIETTAGALESPVLAVHNWSSDAPPRSVRLSGRCLVPGRDYYPSVDADNGLLWLTLAGEVSGPARLQVD